MTLEQLRVFLAVAERQHVTRAAEALNLSQSAVSAQIAGLEARHGVKLFHRVGRGIELTEAGVLFHKEAQAVLARAEAAELVLSELGGLSRGTLTVAASQTIASYWLARHLVAFRRVYAGVDVKLVIGNSSQVASFVKDGTSELGFVEGHIEEPTLVVRPIARDQMIVVVGLEHPWSKRKRVAFDDLYDTEWVFREPGSGTRSEFEEALRAKGVDLARLRVALELPSNDAVRSAVEAGLGAAALSATVVAAGIEAGLLHAVGIELPDREFYVLRHAERYQSKAGEALLSVVASR